MAANHPIPTNHAFQDLVGGRFTMLSVEAFAGINDDRRALWLCRCDCGNSKIVSGKDLKRGHTKSCGCAKRTWLAEAMRRTARKKAEQLIRQRVDPSGVITLPNGMQAFVDPVNLPIVSAHIWGILDNGRNCYARSGHLLMHVLLMGSREGFQVDHCNGNGLDNRRENLRWATSSQNMANKGIQGSSRQRYKGVIPPRGRYKHWRACVTKNGVRHSLGPFASQEQAARAYDAKALELFGDYARINFPEESHGS